MLTERQKRILLAVIQDYIESAEPVGSRTVSKKEGVGYSAATVRNEMADLEEMGFLEQPHTSAGRIPSQKGYRFYVDHLLTPKRWTKEELKVLRDHFSQKIDRVEEAIQQTSSLLSQLTNYMSIILGPKFQESRLKHLQVIPLSERLAVSILVTDNGHVDQRRIVVPEGVSLSHIEKLVNLLNHRLQGVRLSKLKRVVEKELSNEMNRYIGRYEILRGVIDQILEAHPEQHVYLSGATKMLEQPEFRDVEKMKQLLDLVEENDRLIQLLDTPSEGIQVRIGSEIRLQGVDYCSVITASYMINGEPAGTIGILGPTRMDYGKVIGLLDFLAKDFSNRLRRLYE